MNREVEIKTEFIKLDSLIKFAGFAETGGQAKSLVAEGKVKVNGESCLQRGKKVFQGDSVAVCGEKISVKRSEGAGGRRV